MYKSLKSFTTADYQIQLGQILEDNFDTQNVIQEFINTGYIEEYDSTIEITENGVYDVSEYENADVNISGGGSGAFKVPNGMKFAQSSVLPTALDTSEVTDMDYMFNLLKTLTSIPQIDTSNVVTAKNMFGSSSTLISIPQMDTSKVTDAQYFCSGCSNLVNVPQLDFSSLSESSAGSTNCQNLFLNCSSLSNESLNNILAACVTMRPYSTHKKLSKIGLSSEQASVCTTLSNWEACQSAGWSTGY